MKLKHCFWCPCGDACTKEKAIKHAKLCERAHDGMVYVDQKKRVTSTHDECMKLLSELERTFDSSADATSASASSASTTPTDKHASEFDAMRLAAGSESAPSAVDDDIPDKSKDFATTHVFIKKWSGYE